MIARAIRAAQYRAASGARSARVPSRGARAVIWRRSGARGPAAGSGGERRPAAARRLGVRVREAESGAVQTVREIERRPVEDEVALPVDEDAHAVLLVHLVSLDGVLLERQLVRHAGAAAADDGDPQTVPLEFLLLQDALDLFRRLVRDVNHRSSLDCFIALSSRPGRAPPSTVARWIGACAPPPRRARSPHRPPPAC